MVVETWNVLDEDEREALVFTAETLKWWHDRRVAEGGGRPRVKVYR